MTARWLLGRLCDCQNCWTRALRVKRWNFEKRRRETVVVEPFVKTALIRDQEFSQVRRPGKFRKRPCCGLTDKEVVVLEKSEQLRDVFSGRSAVKARRGRRSLARVSRAQATNNL
jgi:hypothetical protein